MICYRAETAMTNVMMPYMTKFVQDTGKATIKSIFKTPANIIPDYEKESLTIDLHYLTPHKKDKIIYKLMETLNNTDFKFPGTKLKLSYKFVSI